MKDPIGTLCDLILGCLVAIVLIILDFAKLGLR